VTTWLLLCVASPAALAHTTVKAQTTEGLREDNALRIGHGCEEQPVIAQSVVFPTDAPEIQVTEPGIQITDLSQVIAQGSLAGLVAAIQDRNIFERQGETLDPLGNVVGFHGRNGRLQVELGGRVPFAFTAPNFVAESCAKRLLIRVAIADICKLKSPTVRPGKVNLWIPDNGSAFATEARAQGIDGLGEPATLIVNRNLSANPLGASCNGITYDVTVTPSAAQVDRDLPIGQYWKLR
jgi:hypothetical protein